MRIKEVIFEDFGPDIIEDDADSRGDANLITALEFLRNQAGNKHLVPKVLAKSLIDMVQRSGHPEFNFAALDDAYKTNDAVKNLIKKIEDDQNGDKYVYLSSMDPSEDPAMGGADPMGGDVNADMGGGTGVVPATDKTVSSMAKSALSKRS